MLRAGARDRSQASAESLPLAQAIDRALLAHPEIDALACIGMPTFRVLASSARDASARDSLEAATVSASQLCVVPVLDGDGLDEGEELSGVAAMAGRTERRVHESVVVSSSAVHAYACSAGGVVVAVGVTRGGANVALLLANVRGIADALEADWAPERDEREGGE